MLPSVAEYCFTLRITLPDTWKIDIGTGGWYVSVYIYIYIYIYIYYDSPAPSVAAIPSRHIYSRLSAKMASDEIVEWHMAE